MAAPSGADGEVIVRDCTCEVWQAHCYGRGVHLRRAREGELGRRSKRSWPGPRPRRAILAYSPDRARGVPAHHGLNCGLRGRTAHKRERTKVLSLLRITLSPSGRASRVKAGSHKTVATHLPLQHGGAKCHPVGVRSARPSRPLRSDFREGRCHPGGESARAPAPSLWRALLRAPCILDGQDAPAEAAHKGKSGCARFPRLSSVFHSEDSHRRMPGRAIPPVPLPR